LWCDDGWEKSFWDRDVVGVGALVVEIDWQKRQLEEPYQKENKRYVVLRDDRLFS